MGPFDVKKETKIEVYTMDSTMIYDYKNRTNIAMDKTLPTIIFIHGYTGGDMHLLIKDGTFQLNFNTLYFYS